MFTPLTQEQIAEIITLALSSLEQRLSERDISLELTEQAKKFIAKQAYEPAYGARPVKRYLQNHLENELAKMIVSGEVYDDCKVIADVDGGELKLMRK